MTDHPHIRWEENAEGDTWTARLGAGYLVLHANPSGGEAMAYVADHDSLLNEPIECREKDCSYYSHYLAYGPAELTHTGFHAAESAARKHFDSCARMEKIGSCLTCEDHERRVRA